MIAPAVTLEFCDRAFFAVPPKQIKVESDPNTGRVYFISKDRIVAVGKEQEGRP